MTELDQDTADRFKQMIVDSLRYVGHQHIDSIVRASVDPASTFPKTHILFDYPVTKKALQFLADQIDNGDIQLDLFRMEQPQ